VAPHYANRSAGFKQRVLSEYPNTDEDSLADTLEGITDGMIAAVIRSALVDDALHSGLRCRVDDA
jgi:hypothetical protein